MHKYLTKTFKTIFVYLYIFFEKVKIEYNIKSKESFLAQDVLGKGHQSQTIFTKGTCTKKRTRKEKTLSL